MTSTTPSDTLPFFYAVQKGMFDRAGLDVTVVASPSGSSSIVAVVGGAVATKYKELATDFRAQEMFFGAAP